MIRPHRQHPLWLAHILHRISGVGLVLFLPVHFYLLSLAVTDADALDSALQFSAHPLVKFAEWGLVFLLSVHLFGGIRLMVLELFPAKTSNWNSTHKTLAAWCVALAFFVSGTFLIGAL